VSLLPSGPRPIPSAYAALNFLPEAPDNPARSSDETSMVMRAAVPHPGIAAPGFCDPACRRFGGAGNA